MMKRHQHITKLQSELIQEKMFIDLKLDEDIAKHCYLEKTKYELLLLLLNYLVLIATSNEYY